MENFSKPRWVIREVQSVAITDLEYGLCCSEAEEGGLEDFP